jgi:hypothetical protein
LIVSRVTSIVRRPVRVLRCFSVTISVAHQIAQHPDREAVGHQNRLGAPIRRVGDCSSASRSSLPSLRENQRHCTPVSVSRGGCSPECGRASAPSRGFRTINRLFIGFSDDRGFKVVLWLGILIFVLIIIWVSRRHHGAHRGGDASFDQPGGNALGCGHVDSCQTVATITQGC